MIHKLAARRRRDGEGFALVEVLIAVVIMATATVTLGAVLISLFTLTEQHRGATTTDGALRSYAEAVEQISFDQTAATYLPCPSAAQLTPSGFTFQDDHVSASPLVVEYWNPNATPPAFQSGNAGRDNCFTNYNNKCDTFGMADCNLDSSSTAPLAHLCPVCDPGLVRVTVAIVRSDGSGQHGAVTFASQILLKRGNVGGTT